MPLRKPEIDHDGLFRAHRKARHLEVMSGDEKTAPEPSPREPDAGVETKSRPTEEVGAPKSKPPRKARRVEEGRGASHVVAGKTVVPPSASDDVGPAPKGTVRTIKVSLRYPAPGTSPALDALAAEIGEDKAVRSLLRRAFDDYRRALDAGNVGGSMPTYVETSRTVTTTRRIAERTYRAAADHLDPSRLLSERAFAQLLAKRALAAFFEAEQRAAATSG